MNHGFMSFPNTNVRRSSKMSFNKLTIYLSIAMYVIYPELYLGENSHQNWTYGSRDIAIIALLKTIKYQRNWTLSFAISKSQY